MDWVLLSASGVQVSSGTNSSGVTFTLLRILAGKAVAITGVTTDCTGDFLSFFHPLLPSFNEPFEDVEFAVVTAAVVFVTIVVVTASSLTMEAPLV